MKDNETIGLKSIIVKYLLHWKLFLGAFIFSILLAVLYLVFYPKTYEVFASVQLAEDKSLNSGSIGMGEAAGLMKSFGLANIPSGALNLEDELQVFQSNNLFRKMILELKLNVEYSIPYKFGYRLYNTADFVLKADEKTEEELREDVVFKISQKGPTIKVKTETKSSGKKKFEFSNLPAEIILPQGNFTLDYANPSKITNLSTIEVLYRPASFQAEDLLDEFNIEDYSKNSFIIELSYKDHEQQRGLDMLNSLIRHYNQTSREYVAVEMNKSISYFDLRIDSLVDKLLGIELSIEKYKHANKLTDIETDVLFYAEQMKELQIKLLEMEAKAHSIVMMSDFVRNPENKYNLVPMLLDLESGDKNPITMYNELLLERSKIVQNSSSENPLAAVVTDKVDQLRSSVYLTIDNARESIALSVKDLKDKENGIYRKMGNFPLQEREFIDLKRQQEILQGVYLILLQKREEAALSADNEFDKARVIETPYVKMKPVAPRKLYAAFFIFLLTILIPVVFVFCREQYLDLKKILANTKK